MEKADFKKGNTEYDAYNDLFFFHKTYGQPEKRDEYWTSVIEQASAINDKYKATTMAGIVARHLIGLMDKWNREVGEA